MKRMYSEASAGQDVFVLLFVLCLLFYVPSLSPSMRAYRHVEIHTTLPAHSKGFPPETTRSSFFYSLPSIFFSLVASFKPIIQHYLRFTVYFAAAGGASSLSHPFFSFECTSSPSHSLGCGVNFHYTSKV